MSSHEHVLDWLCSASIGEIQNLFDEFQDRTDTRVLILAGSPELVQMQQHTNSQDVTQGKWDLWMKYYGIRKIAVIKVARKLGGLDLKTAKEWVERVPAGSRAYRGMLAHEVLFSTYDTKTEADNAANEFQSAGAIVEVRPTS